MPTYVALIDWTDQGVRNFKDTVDRYDAAQSAFESLGVRFTDTWWTLGAHDIVATVEAPDDGRLRPRCCRWRSRATSARPPSAHSPGRRCGQSSARWAEPVAGAHAGRTAALACNEYQASRRSRDEVTTTAMDEVQQRLHRKQSAPPP